MNLPTSARFVVIGAGVHGLSSAYHLAKELKARGVGSGADVIVVDKTGVAAGASGIACGVVRNNYYQPAMSELMAANVEVWESDPAAYHYHGVGSRRRWRASHDACGLSRLQNRDIFSVGARFYFCHHRKHHGKLSQVAGTDSVAIPHGTREGWEVTVGEHGFGQHLSGSVQQIHQFFAAWMQTGGMVFHQMAGFLEA